MHVNSNIIVILGKIIKLDLFKRGVLLRDPGAVKITFKKFNGIQCVFFFTVDDPHITL